MTWETPTPHWSYMKLGLVPGHPNSRRMMCKLEVQERILLAHREGCTILVHLLPTFVVVRGDGQFNAPDRGARGRRQAANCRSGCLQNDSDGPDSGIFSFASEALASAGISEITDTASTWTTFPTPTASSRGPAPASGITASTHSSSTPAKAVSTGPTTSESPVYLTTATAISWLSPANQIIRWKLT
uniref:Uncharacterized protein n=1 Tax=Sphaerodactylus townsendi TaxID=933632 RepID=A0ACB8FN81_9SAUR